MGMMVETNWVRLQFLSRSENLSFARAAAAAFIAQLDCTLQDLEEIKIVVSEAVSNCIIHAYAGSGNGVITVELKIYPDRRAEITVEDEGCGIEDVEKAMQPAYSTVPERMGLGFVLMKSFVDHLEVDSALGQGTKVKMVKSFLPVNDGLSFSGG